jgi:PAS domain-containing protein
MLAAVSDAVARSVAEREAALTGVGACIVSLTALLGLALLPDFVASGDAVRWFLRLLLLCEPRIVMDSKALSKILTDDFSATSDEAEECSRFFEPLAAHAMDPTFFLDNALSVRAVNRRACDPLGQSEEQLLGRRRFDVLRGSDANIASFREFRETVESALLGLCSPCVDRDVEVAAIGGARSMHASLVAVNGAGSVQWEPSLPDGIALFTPTLRDLSEGLRARARTRVEEERARVRALLSVHLPPRVRDRRESDGGPIACSVPGTSFVCVHVDGMDDNADVIPTIHALFVKFDAAVARQSEMTPLRATGVVYHAIAGAFAEGGQAQANVLQAVTAALGCVEAVAAWNRAVGSEKALTIRAAVEVGEKMVAGVLEMNVPSFQIFGAPFTEAERMTEAAPPMSVLITQKIYELVLYAAQFSIREGPTVRIGPDAIRTYVVRAQDE